MSTETKFEDFVKILEEDVKRFADYWGKGIEESPGFYPAEMSLGEWGDQFLTFLNFDYEEE